MRTSRALLFVTLSLLAACRAQEPAAPPAAAEQKPPEVVWRTVASWSGRGSTLTDTFIIENPTWRLRWESRNESPSGKGSLHVTANSGDSGRVLAELVDVQGTGHDVAYISELPRRYYLVVTSENVDWTVAAEEPTIP